MSKQYKVLDASVARSASSLEALLNAEAHQGWSLHTFDGRCYILEREQSHLAYTPFSQPAIRTLQVEKRDDEVVVTSGGDTLFLWGKYGTMKKSTCNITLEEAEAIHRDLGAIGKREIAWSFEAEILNKMRSKTLSR